MLNRFVKEKIYFFSNSEIYLNRDCLYQIQKYLIPYIYVQLSKNILYVYQKIIYVTENISSTSSIPVVYGGPDALNIFTCASFCLIVLTLNIINIQIHCSQYTYIMPHTMQQQDCLKYHLSYFTRCNNNNKIRGNMLYYIMCVCIYIIN